MGRLVFDISSLPLIAGWAFALLQGADYSNLYIQVLAYGLGIVTVVDAVLALFINGGYLSSLGVASLADTIILTLKGSFPALLQLIPAAGFAWLAWDSNVEVPAEEDEELAA